ncbi:MAG: hypothetical protein NUV63_05670 [Gallionella sp.]|nr:hypothetical protein [Gallionella sp.]
MTNEIRNLLDAMAWTLNRDLDRLHDELLAKLRSMARSTGQRTRADRVKRFSLEPDDHIEWIYDPRHPDYNSEHAEHLRERMARAISSAPRWMFGFGE